MVEESFNSTAEITKQELLPLIPNCNNRDELPKSCSTPKRKQSLNITLSNENNDFTMDSPPPYETMNMEQLNQLLPNDDELSSPPPSEPPPIVKDTLETEEHNQSSSNDLVIDEDALVEQHENVVAADSEDNATEFKIPLNASEAKEGKSITFNLPGMNYKVIDNLKETSLLKYEFAFNGYLYEVKAYFFMKPDKKS